MSFDEPIELTAATANVSLNRDRSAASIIVLLMPAVDLRSQPLIAYCVGMNKRNLVKYSKFYVQLETIEKEIRDVIDLGLHLKTAEPGLFKKLDDAADAITNYFDKQDEMFVPK